MESQSIVPHNKWTSICGIMEVRDNCSIFWVLSWMSMVLSGPRVYTRNRKAGSWGKSIRTYTDLQLGPNLPKTYTFTPRILSCILKGARTYTPFRSWVLVCPAGHILWVGPWEYMIRECIFDNSDLAQDIHSNAEIKAIFVHKIGFKPICQIP
jgi:hypothetical protein